MSGLYPVAVPATALYSTDTTRRHKIGTRGIFQTVNGPVEAVYVKNANTATINAGSPVHHSGTAWAANTTLYADTGSNALAGSLIGVMCASLPGSATEAYAWAAVRGPVTAMRVAATAASSNHNGVLYGINLGTDANMASVAATAVVTVASVVNNRLMVIGIGGGATSTIATSGSAGPAFINLFWR